MQTIKVNKLHSLTGHRDSVYALQKGRTQNGLFSAGGDGMVARWNLEAPGTGELIAQLPNSIYALHYLSDHDQLIAAQNFEGIHLLDYINKKELRSLKLSKTYFFDVQSHGNKLLVAGGDGVVSIIDVNSWSVIDRVENSKQSARTIVINKERGEFAVGYSDNTIRVFDLFNYKLRQEWLAHSNSVFTLQFTLDGKYLVSGSRDAHLKVWNAGKSYELVDDIAAHMYTINHLVFSPDGKHFVTCSMDKSIKVWDSLEFRLLKVIDKARHAGHGNSVNKLIWTSFNNQLVSASDDRTLSVWDIIF